MLISAVINKYIEKELKLPFIIYDNLIPDEKETGACLRYDPAPAAEERYIDGSRRLTWNLTYYIRSKKSEQAQQYAYNITNCLDGITIEDAETKIEIETEAATLPQFISKDEKGFVTYAAAITSTYMEENKWQQKKE